MLAQGYRNAPIHQRPRELKQFTLIGVDLKGPLPRTKEGYDNIVVIADPTSMRKCIRFEGRGVKWCAEL